MLAFHERRYAATERYRIPILLASTRPLGRDIQAEHSARADAVLARDAEAAVSLLRLHYEQTSDFIAGQMWTSAKRGKPAA